MAVRYLSLIPSDVQAKAHKFDKWFVVQNLKTANKKLIFKLLVRNSSEDKRRNDGKKSLFDFLIKLNENDFLNLLY